MSNRATSPQARVAQDDGGVAGSRRFPGERPLALSDYVKEEISRAIAEGRLPPGKRVSAQTVAEELSVSHIPVREALRGLEADGHVVWIERRGFFVRELSVADLDDIYRWRQVLEDEAHRIAVTRLEESHFAEMERLHARMDEVAPADWSSFARLNRQLHFIAFRVTGSSRLLSFLENLWDAAARYQSALLRSGGDIPRLQRQHRELIAAFKARDAERVNRLMVAHRKVTVREIRSGLAARVDGQRRVARAGREGRSG